MPKVQGEHSRHSVSTWGLGPFLSRPVAQVMLEGVGCLSWAGLIGVDLLASGGVHQ